MHTVRSHVSPKKIAEVFICQHIEIPAPTFAAAQLPLSMWTRIGGLHPLSMDINFYQFQAIPPVLCWVALKIHL